jgi:hypothetical protein
MASDAFEGTERFAVRRRLGAGVYEVFDRARGEPVALKTLRGADPDAVRRFKQEVRALADLAHPNLVSLHELHAEDERWFLTMDLVDGVDLATYVREGGDLRNALAQLAQGVDALHAAGRLHRNLKASNVLVTPEPRVVLVDFGVIAELSGAGADATPASDWSAVGAMLRDLLADDAPADLAQLRDALLRGEPALATRRRDVSLIGRDSARAILRGALADARQGTGSVVHVAGRSGMGKSALCAAFLEEAAQDGAVVLRGRCYPQESVPYAAVDDLVDALARHLATLPDAVLPRDAHLLPAVFPVLGTVITQPRDPPKLEPHEVRRRAFAALRELLTALARQRPLVLFIDDVQWGDADSAPVLDALMRPPAPPALVLVLAYRTEEQGALLAALGQRRERLGVGIRTLDVPVGALARDDARELAITLGAEPARAGAIARESGGVPFFVHELARAAPGATLDGVLAARLGGLDRGERVVVELVAVAARPIARTFLASASSLVEGELDRAIARVVATRLLRAAKSGDELVLECYHDRIREAVDAAMSPERRREHHARLASALAAAATPDLEALVVHCAGAGRKEAAADYALRAAEAADRTFAFDRAAELYATALALGTHDATRARRIRTALGDALAHAGRGGEAAEAYTAAAVDAPAADALELRRRAASSYLRSGLVDDGARVLADVLAEVGGKMPASPLRAMLSLGWQRVRLRLRLRGLDFERRDPTQVSAYDLARVDVMRSAATDLGMVDTLVGADFATRQLRGALALGEPLRVARALIVEAQFLAAQGPRAAERFDEVMARAETLARQFDDPELPAWLSAARGLAEYQHGRFRSAAAYTSEAVRWLQEQCAGAMWEVGGAEVQLLWSLFYLGELRELSAHVDAHVEQARTRGNRFDEANASTGLPALAWAVADRVPEGREVVARAIAAWTPRGFHLQHYYAVLTLASFDLYEGDAATAARRIDERWQALRRSGLMMCPSVAIEAHHLRGRAAVACGDTAVAKRAIAALQRWGAHPWASSMALLLEGGLHPDRLGAAANACAQADMPVFAAAARRDLAALSAAGVADPQRFARMLVPTGAADPSAR